MSRFWTGIIKTPLYDALPAAYAQHFRPALPERLWVTRGFAIADAVAYREPLTRPSSVRCTSQTSACHSRYSPAPASYGSASPGISRTSDLFVSMPRPSVSPPTRLYSSDSTSHGEPDDDSPRLTHTDATGRARMVDVTGKTKTVRTARASGRVQMAPETYDLIKDNLVKKGDVVTTAELAGIMAAKRTADLIPLCHPVPISHVAVACSLDEVNRCVVVTAVARSDHATGVEMEALTAVSVSCLTIYDMCKAAEKGMVITDIELLEKTGGKSGDYQRQP